MKNTYIVDIFDMSYEGAGVGKLDGQVVFVPKTLIGEKVEIEIVKKTSSFLIGKLVNVLETNSQRVDVKCPYFSECGGCDFLHCQESLEKEIKIDILKKELNKVGFDGKIEFISSSKRFYYRNKIKLDVVDGKLNYTKSKSKEKIEIKKCIIATEKINELFSKVEAFLAANKLTGLKSVYFKQVGNQLTICFLFEKNTKKHAKNLKNIEILQNFSVFFAYGEVLESNATEVFNVFGGDLKREIFGFEVEEKVSAFNQINEDIEKKLYQYICDETSEKRVVNAYSGQGLLTLLISQNAYFVYGIEYQNDAHRSAEKLCKKYQNEYKIENICGKVEEKLQFIVQKDKIDMIVLDPAREGCKKEVLNSILSNQICEVLYVSCNFSSLVRDLQILRQKYDIEKVQIFDMFPCTANMETVCKLRIKSGF